MTINEEELLSLAITGAASECNFWKDMDDKEKAWHYQQLLDLVANAESIKDILEKETAEISTYKVTLRHDQGFSRFEKDEVVKAESAQKAADIIRDKFPEMYVYTVYREVNSWC